MYYCIVNPSARSGKGKEIWDNLEKRFIEKKIEYQVVYTKGPGHATRLASQITEKIADDKKKGHELPKKIVVMGGDGTLNEAINGIKDFDNTLLGYIPIGSSNDFARDLDYPKNIDDLLNRIVEGKVRRHLDLGKLTYNAMSRDMSRLHDEHILNTRLFDVSSGIGFDAAVCEEALSSGTKNFFNKIGLGKLTYGTIAIKQLLGAEKIPCEVKFADGNTVKLDHFIVITAMIHHYEGGGFKFAPKADLTDGLFDICMAGNLGRFKMLGALPFVFFGHHYWIRGIDHYLTDKITIKTDKPMWVHTDGEVSVKSDNITLECLRKKLQLMS
ncbi:diacylglycerol kinase family lipid kinase [Butyrivibrio sp. DSM 10294]|uniref:diacylglycerol/lipid kinase family protein n=1 Tax=Butyrivibrio sp. DSM 10294 TaxID=2972457 RepID=UPI00234E951E|nr:diacylglycerol kinase family protein [Butyrivibrio sp. DSM 10294]MDC7294086.1 diacylglycerol kinase family lipid kinase [Butyrivibrio sp. DSM 10294]